MRQFGVSVVTTVSLLLASASAASAATSQYTSLAAPACRERALDPDDPVDGGGRTCSGAAGWSLNIDTGDDRDFVVAVPPRQARGFDLRLSEVVTTAFSWVGPRAEWRSRSRGAAPYALIIRLGHQRQDGVSNTSVLVVTRLDRQCVTAVIPAGPQQNERARTAADTPGACLPSFSG